mmetsp:Transcript_52334/g.94186  ORF Transcript_52334/g.94186 Transcript_52334/m.94186 type:complete len:331 (+) Transcript_52334:158-1150(+)|eukprot:CAMPEP_0115108650 /NCGR_PEP_ID=MMETSP0227-20121206/38132_1 /TAXON_ID=89957 /ORGANISM="Polarella glacialis, Strain CCMP 1383" /LENGTH=330 /DNA_ID=CAMNT_0002506989 /DNA_START=156 /DNA_END=1148 /DNA_ORIENTATION=+
MTSVFLHSAGSCTTASRVYTAPAPGHSAGIRTGSWSSPSSCSAGRGHRSTNILADARCLNWVATAGSLILSGQIAKCIRRDRLRVTATACRSSKDGLQDFKLLAGQRALDSGLASLVTVHFVRHSEALVNAAGRAFAKDDPRKKAVRLDPAYFDSPLSEKGLAHAVQLRAGQLDGRGAPPKVEVVAVSPLTRALQTATAVFGCDENDGPRLYALEALREFCGKSYQPCDSRRPPEELQLAFPHADFQAVPSGADTLLGPGRIETAESADSRIRALLSWIRTQQHGSIACVAHMQILTRIFKDHLEPAGLDGSTYGDFGNLEVRSVPLAFD